MQFIKRTVSLVTAVFSIFFLWYSFSCYLEDMMAFACPARLNYSPPSILLGFCPFSFLSTTQTEKSVLSSVNGLVLHWATKWRGLVVNNQRWPYVRWTRKMFLQWPTAGSDLSSNGPTNCVLRFFGEKAEGSSFRSICRKSWVVKKLNDIFTCVFRPNYFPTALVIKQGLSSTNSTTNSLKFLLNILDVVSKI